MSAKDALIHEWLIGPLLGYWAVAGIEWRPVEEQTKECEIVQKKSIDLVEEKVVVKEENQGILRFYDFSKLQDDNDDDDPIEDPDEEVSLVYTESSPTKPLPFINHTAQDVSTQYI
jgi:hypothetical protein